MAPRDSPRTLLERGREAYGRRAWLEAYDALAASAEAAPLAVADLDRMADAAQSAGRDEEFLKALERVYQARLDEGAPLLAARAAFWIGFRSMFLGEAGRSNAWLARAQALVDAHPSECPDHGYLLLAVAFRHQMMGRHEATHDVGAQIAGIGERTGDRGLAVFGRSLQGRALIRQGQLERGMALLDESMLAAIAEPISPVFTGLIYCGVIATYKRVYALERAREWTAALSDWCEAQGGFVGFSGACLVHRAELLRIGGAWPEALEEARHACRLVRPNDPDALSDANYQEGEIHRLTGAFEAAEQCFKVASQHGREPQPGLSLLRMEQGRPDVSAVRRLIAEANDPLARAKLLPAAVELHLALGEREAALHASRQLDEIAAAFATEVLEALAAHARGLVHLADGDAQAALGPLRRAFWVWQKLGAPYLAARVRVELARACRALGDGEGARMELEAARAIFTELGAAPDLAASDALADVEPTKTSHGLTQRELQVLRLVAAGKTNKVIARELFLSEKTVDRHVSNIFVKADVPSRAAATAWAYEHHLI
jgi:DNA-binding CsgD family transcriptional regulator